MEQIEEKQVRPGAWRGFSAKLTPFLIVPGLKGEVDPKDADVAHKVKDVHRGGTPGMMEQKKWLAAAGASPKVAKCLVA